MLGSNPSADSAASTDRGGCYGIPFSLSVGRAPSAADWPTQRDRATPKAASPFRSGAPSYNALERLEKGLWRPVKEVAEFAGVLSKLLILKVVSAEGIEPLTY